MNKEQTRSTIDEILSRIDIVDLISENVVLKKSGSGFQGLCPFHQEKTSSFHVNQQKQIFKCFGCGVGGNVFEYYKSYHHLSFIDTLKELSQRCGLEVNFNEYKSEESIKKEEVKKTIYEIYKTTMEFYRWNLTSNNAGEIARNYLKDRKVAANMIEQFLIGYSPNSWDSLILYLQKKGFSPEEIKESGLVAERADGGSYDRFRNRLMFPIQNEKDEVIAFGGRTLDTTPNQAKYINSPETSIYIKGQHLYALNFAKNKIREKDEVILVEGYLDVISCHEAGFENTVASLGTALTPEQAKKLLRYNTSKKVIVAYDSDNAGRRAAEKGTAVLEDVSKGTGIHIYVLQVPSGKDPDEFLHTEGAGKFQDVINSAKPIIEFQIEQALSVDFSTPESKSEVVEKCVVVLKNISNEVYRNEMIKKISNWSNNGQRLNVREEDIKRRLSININSTNEQGGGYKPFNQYKSQYNNGNGNFQKKDYSSYNNKFKNPLEVDYVKKKIIQTSLMKYEKIPGALQAEKGIIYYMIERHKAVEYIKKRLDNIIFQDPLNERIKNTIFEINQEKELKDWHDLLKVMTDSDEQQRVVEIWEGFSNISVASDKILKDYLKQVKLNFLAIQRDEIKFDIDEAAKVGNHEIIGHLMKAYKEVQNEIKKIEKEIYSSN